jgi:hypothetical protein
MRTPVFRLGQLDFGLTSGLARSIVAEVEPATRRVIKEERTKYSEALIGGIPWAAAGAISAIATYYLVPPEKRTLKFAGYAGGAALIGAGSLFTISALAEPPAGVAAPSSKVPGSIQSVAEQAAKAVIAEAEPKVRAIVEEERFRIAEALQAGLPLQAASVLTLIATLLMVKGENPIMKAVGYSASVALFTGGIWMTLEAEK